MDITKTWYHSKTVWGASWRWRASSLQAMGVDLMPDVHKDIADLAMAVAGMVGVATFVYGRIAASTVIGRNVRG